MKIETPEAFCARASAHNMSTFQGVTVMVFHPGFLTTADTTAIANQTGTANQVYTSAIVFDHREGIDCGVRRRFLRSR